MWGFPGWYGDPQWAMLLAGVPRQAPGDVVNQERWGDSG